MSVAPQTYHNDKLMEPVFTCLRGDRKHPPILYTKPRNGFYPTKISVSFAIEQKS